MEADPSWGPARLSTRSRSARGRFLPVADVTLEGATATEIARYAERAKTFENDWRQLDPLMIGVQRMPVGEAGQERIVIDAQVAPLGEEKYGWLLALLGPATTQRVAADAGELASAQAYVQGGPLSAVIPPHLLFVGLENVPTAADRPSPSVLPWLQVLRTAPGYLGAWPKPGFLDRLPVWLQGDTGADGFSLMPLGVWRWQGGDFSVLSFRKEVLDRVGPQLHVEEAGSAAQIRVRASDLSQSQLAPWLNALYYQRAQQASLGNVRLLHLLSNQLGVPRDKALETANRLLDTRLVCSVGGEVRSRRPSGRAFRVEVHGVAGGGRNDSRGLPAPLLNWLRGLDLAVVKEEGRLTLHAELTVQRQVTAGIDPTPLLRGLFEKQP